MSERARAAGIIAGDIRVGGFPKVQHTFARVMGYVEQSDIHSPMVRIAARSNVAYAKRCCPCEADLSHRACLAVGSCAILRSCSGDA